MATKATGPKIPPQRIPSDDFVLTLDGEDYALHAGESIWRNGTTTVAEMKMLRRFHTITPELMALEDEPPDVKSKESTRLLVEALEICAPVLSERITRWDWTDNNRNALPQPSEDGAFQSLTLEEVTYLVNAISGGAPAERKNG